MRVDWCWAFATASKFCVKQECFLAHSSVIVICNFIARISFLKTANANSPFTNKTPDPGKIIRVPIAHGEGCYFADDATLEKLKANNQIIWQVLRRERKSYG